LEVKLPYIPKEDRVFYDKTIKEICEALHNSDNMVNPGHLNYVITRICKDVFERNAWYGTIADITGVLENVKQELYRRQFAAYEDAAIEKNGDL